MASTFQWSELLGLAREQYAKGIPLDGAKQLLVTNMVSGTIWTRYPFRETLTDIASGLLPLVNGQQDYSVPSNTFRITKLSLVRTDVTPDEHLQLTVGGDLDIDLVPKSPYTVKNASHQAGVGLIRLESAVQVSSGTTWEIQGERQTHHAKITSISTAIWFDDEFASMAHEGYLYWLYRLADDPRAGGIVKVENGRAQYSGQLAAFMAEIDKMAAAQDHGGIDSLFPCIPMGAGRDFGWPTIIG